MAEPGCVVWQHRTLRQREFLRYLYDWDYNLPHAGANDVPAEILAMTDGTRPDFYYAGPVQACVFLSNDQSPQTSNSVRKQLEGQGVEVVSLGGADGWSAAIQAKALVFGRSERQPAGATA